MGICLLSAYDLLRFIISLQSMSMKGLHPQAARNFPCNQLKSTQRFFPLQFYLKEAAKISSSTDGQANKRGRGGGGTGRAIKDFFLNLKSGVRP